MKLVRILLSTIAVGTLAACGNLSEVNKDGASDHLVWPQISENTFNHDGSQFGSWPNWNNVRMIERGMNKDQIRQLIGDPQFSEGLYGVREWDYAFNYRDNGVHKICQYKVLFDSKMNAQNFYWFPNGCYGNSTYTLSDDFLFDFNKATLTENGIKQVDNIAEQLIHANPKVVKVAGFTDRLGSDAYNLKLSQRRANTVKARLIKDGVKAEINAVGYGEAQQVKACDGVTGKELKDCLRPNRRVEITSHGELIQSNETYEMNAGKKGPAILYKK